MNKAGEEIINNYYKGLMLISDEEEIIDSIPSTKFENLFFILNGIIDRLIKAKEALYELLEEATVPEDKEEIEKEIALIDKKIKYCTKRLEEGKEIVEVEEKAEQAVHKEIIFATSKMGNVCVEEDIKDIPQEYFERIIECFQDIENNVGNNNTAKKRKFTNNAKLAKTLEAKRFKIRVLYKNLTPDTAYVFIVRIKKSDNQSKETDEIYYRYMNVDDEYEMLREEMKDEEKKKMIIEKNRKVKERILKRLSTSGAKQYG